MNVYGFAVVVNRSHGADTIRSVVYVYFILSIFYPPEFKADFDKNQIEQTSQKLTTKKSKLTIYSIFVISTIHKQADMNYEN